jgi:hypothetical protein
MYRIELAPGEVTVFRTIEELATGVRNGVITSKARIYHAASEKWLPIEFHPHYKKALELLSGGAEAATSKPAERPKNEALTFLGTPVAAVTPIPSLPAPAPVVAATPASVAPVTPVPVEPASPPPVAAAPSAPSPTSLTPTASHSVTAAPVAAHPAAPATIPAHQCQAPEVRPPAAAHRVAIEAESQERERRRKAVELEHADEDDAAEQAALDAVEARWRAALEGPVEPQALVAAQAAAARVPAAPALPAVSASPVLELPRITYPEIRPVEEPVSERASASSRTRRPLHLAGALLLLALGGYASATFLSPGRSGTGFSAASIMADRPTIPPAAPAAAAPVAAPAPAKVPSSAAAPPGALSRGASPVTGSAPKAGAATRPATPAAAPPASQPQAPLPPASSGFAPALEPRAIVTTPAKTPSAPQAGDSTTIAAPAIDMHVAAPLLPGAESLAVPPRQKGDSAMKKILRAVSGKPIP